MKGFCLSVFLIFLSINIAIPQNIHICDYKFNQTPTPKNWNDLNPSKDHLDMNPQILSIFNLKEDLIIQIKNKVDESVVLFWRVYGIVVESIDSNDGPIFAKNVLDNLHLSSNLKDDIKALKYFHDAQSLHPLKISISLLSKVIQRYDFNRFVD